MGRRSKYQAQFKARVAFEAAKGDRSISEIASEYGIHPQQVRAWKREFLEKMHLAFEKDKDTLELQKELEKAYKKIGQLEVERDFLSGLEIPELALSIQNTKGLCEPTKWLPILPFF